jgi:hypothetical protein
VAVGADAPLGVPAHYAKAYLAQNREPDLLFILADDLGWRDLRCVGSDCYETPNIGRLAEDGGRKTHRKEAKPTWRGLAGLS